VATGAVTLIQRFGSALNLNSHLHMLFLDGAYRFDGNKARFHRARRASHDELVQLLDTLSRRIIRVLERRGLLIADPVDPDFPSTRKMCFVLPIRRGQRPWQQVRGVIQRLPELPNNSICRRCYI